jgi:hypothetical protein
MALRRNLSAASSRLVVPVHVAVAVNDNDNVKVNVNVYVGYSADTP